MRVPRLAGRPRRGLTAVAFGATGILVGTLVGAGPAAAAGVGTLKLNPDHGRPTAAFSISYEYPQQNNACAKVSFTWDDGIALGSGQGTHGLRTSPCLLTLMRVVPPEQDSAAGRHTVAATFAGQARPAQAATYTVLPGPTSSAKPSPTPTRTSATPTRQPTVQPTDDTVAGGVNASQAAVAPLDTGAPSVAGVATGGGSGGGGLVSWVLIFGGLLVLGGIVIFGLLIYWTRRGGPGDVEPDTQVIGE